MEAVFNSAFGLTGVEVHSAIFEERFRDACSHGDLDAAKSIVNEMVQHQKIVDLIHSPSPSGSPFFDAILANNCEVIEYLFALGYDLELEYDVDINIPIVFRDRCAALCLACACGEVEVVQLLLNLGASVNHMSLHSSPVIYASQYNNVNLISILLDRGADVTILPKSFHSHSAVLPLYQACFNGHKDTAELFLKGVNADMSRERQICFLGLLGAQCINKNEDFEGGLKYWKMALTLLGSVCQMDSSSRNVEEELAKKLKRLYIEGSSHSLSSSHSPSFHSASFSGKSDVGIPRGIDRRVISIFRDMQLCTTLEELDLLASDKSRLVLQALLVLQTILGPSHFETTQQVSQAARFALEEGDLTQACKLFLYAIECNESLDQTETATDYSSQLADLLLNIFCSSPENLQKIENFVDLLVAVIELVVEGMIKVQCKLFPAEASKTDHSVVNLGIFDSQVKCHSKIKLFTEMVETFMAFLRLFIEQESCDEHWRQLRRPVSTLLSFCQRSTAQYSKFSLESEMMKIAVYGDHSAMSTLYFFQEDLFPNVTILKFLLQSGASIDCQDFQGDTPLHHSIDCQKPSKEVIKLLLDHGSDVDICNRQGVTPYQLLQKFSQIGINPSNYLTLKCMAATAIMKSRVAYQGQVPKVLEDFIAVHGLPKIRLLYRKNANGDDSKQSR